MVLRILALPEIEAVIVTGGLNRLFRDGAGGESGPALRARFLDVARALSDAGKRVILVAPAPFAGIDAPTALARAVRFGTEPPEGPTLEAHLADLAPMAEAMEMAASLPGVRTVWPWQAFCADGRCDLERDGRTLYADALHPSPDGARLVAPALTEALRAALPPG